MPRGKQQPKFAVGHLLRVCSAVIDPDFPDIPIGGWTGKIAGAEQGRPPTYLIRWDQRTLDDMHPVYRKRCERDGLKFEEMWLRQDELEPDTGESLAIEQPTKIETKSLSAKNQDDRVRMAFGLTSDDPLPDVDEVTLPMYHEYLLAKLSFPFQAEWSSDSGPFSARVEVVTILGLGEPGDSPWIDEMYGVLCEARLGSRKIDLPLAELEVKGRETNAQLVADYCYWFWNWR